MRLTEGAGAAAIAVLLVVGSARAADPSELDVALRIWAGPEASLSNPDSPFAEHTLLSDERGRGEASLRLQTDGLTAEASARALARSGGVTTAEGVLNELFYTADVLGQQLTAGKRVTSWDVGFGFRPLDVLQQEDRRGLHPFALEGLPQLAWAHFGDETAWELVYAHPLRGRAETSRDDESVAARHFRRVGLADLHLVARYSARTRLQAGVAVAAVLGESIEVHGSFRYQRRGERIVPRLAGADGAILAEPNPLTVGVSPDLVAALVGFVVNPGWDLSVIGEAWFDPAGGTAEEWRVLGALARLQAEEAPRDLAWGARAFERPNLVQGNVLLRVARKWERLDGAVDLLVTPADRGWSATTRLGYQGERARLDGGLRLFGGSRDAAYRLNPRAAQLHVSLQLQF